jgi:hypothetical protein
LRNYLRPLFFVDNFIDNRLAWCQYFYCNTFSAQNKMQIQRFWVVVLRLFRCPVWGTYFVSEAGEYFFRYWDSWDIAFL